jgi:hypothetical protein
MTTTQPYRNGYEAPAAVERMLIERVPPHSLEAEMAVLGSLLVDGEMLPGVASILRPVDFYRAAHAKLYAVMLALRQEGKPIDAILVFHEVERLGALEETGGRDYIATLATAVTSPAHAEHYAGIVREDSLQREAEARLLGDLADIQGGRATPTEIMERDRRRLQVAEAGTTPPAAYWTTGEAIVTAQMADTAFLVQGLLLPGCITLLGAESGCGKSTLLGGIVEAALRGGTVIGLSCAPAPAIVWVTEESKHTFRRILAPCGLGIERLHIMGREQIGSRSWPQIVAAVAAKVAETGATIAVLDPFASLAGLGGDEENQAGPVMAAMRPVLALAGAGPGVLLTHHLNKNNGRTGVSRFRGSGALVAAVDAAVTLDRVGREGSSERVLRAEKGRGPGWVAGVRYQLTTVVRRSVVRYALERVSADEREGHLDDAIVSLIVGSPGLSRTRVEAALEGGTKAKREALKRLTAAGRIEERTGPRGARLCYLAQPRPGVIGEVENVGAGDLASPPLRGGDEGRGQPTGPTSTSPHLATDGEAGSRAGT